jgi:hypothetical protein
MPLISDEKMSDSAKLRDPADRKRPRAGKIALSGEHAESGHLLRPLVLPA